MTSTKQKPVETLRDGAIKATIWKNPLVKGHFYSVEFSRTYKEGTGYKDSHSFSGSDILKLQNIALRAYDHITTRRNYEAILAKTSTGSGA